MATLQDGMVAVRDAIGEGTEYTFNNHKIIKDLNRSARAMCSAAQSIRDTYITRTKVIPARVFDDYDVDYEGDIFYMEYAMPQDCESVTGGSIKIGIEYPLNFKFSEKRLVQGGFTAATPFASYLAHRRTLKQMIPNGGEIIELPIPGNEVGQNYWIVGLSPIPSQVAPLCIDYVAYHPQMDAPASPVLLPENTDFFDAWVGYAISKGMEKQGDQVSADRYMKIHREGKEEFKKYEASMKLQVNPPRYGGGRGMTGPNVSITSPIASQLTIQGE